MEIINMGGQISVADFGQFSLGVYIHDRFVMRCFKIRVNDAFHCGHAKFRKVLMNPLIRIHQITYAFFKGMFHFVHVMVTTDQRVRVKTYLTAICYNLLRARFLDRIA